MRHEQLSVSVLYQGGDKNNDGVIVTNKDGNGYVTRGYGLTVPADGKSGYIKGCLFIDTDKVGSAVYINDGTVASCDFNLIGTLAPGSVTGALLAPGVGYFTVAIATNGTTPVNVFGAGGAPCNLTVTSVMVISKDTTAGNIVLKQAANTVATIAKGTAAGAVLGATSLANAAYTAADVCTVESSSAGDAKVIITFTVA